MDHIIVLYMLDLPKVARQSYLNTAGINKQIQKIKEKVGLRELYDQTMEDVSVLYSGQGS